MFFKDPLSAKHLAKKKLFFTKIKNYLNILIFKKSKLRFAVDFNINMDDINNSENRIFHNILKSYRLVNDINFSTHILGYTVNLIITSSSDNLKVFNTEPSTFISDHRFVRAVFDVKRTPQEIHTLTFRNFKNIEKQLKLELKN